MSNVEKTETAVRNDLDAWWASLGKDIDCEPADLLAEVGEILTGISPATFLRLDSTVDSYPYGWLIRRWRNSRFDSTIFVAGTR